MKILIGGGAGYIGSQLVPHLLSHGYEVDVVDLLWFGNNLPSGVKVIKKNLLNMNKEDFEGYDQFIFLAGLSNDPMAEYSPSENFIQNGAVPSFLAFEAKRAGVKRFIYASSCSVYGYTVNELFDEDAPTTCAYPYGISKLQGEKGVLQLQDENFSVIALRKGTVSGHSSRMRMDLIVNTMFKSAIVDGKITVNNASIWRPIIDMRDVVDGYTRAVQADLGISGVFNLSSDNYTVGQVADIVKEEVEKLSGKKVKMEIKNISDLRNYKVSTAKAKTYLGFSARYGVKEIVHGLYANLSAYGDFENDLFYNIKVFKKLDHFEKFGIERGHVGLNNSVESSVELKSVEATSQA